MGTRSCFVHIWDDSKEDQSQNKTDVPERALHKKCSLWLQSNNVTRQIFSEAVDSKRRGLDLVPTWDSFLETTDKNIYIYLTLAGYQGTRIILHSRNVHSAGLFEGGTVQQMHQPSSTVSGFGPNDQRIRQKVPTCILFWMPLISALFSSVLCTRHISFLAVYCLVHISFLAVNTLRQVVSFTGFTGGGC